MFRGEYPADWEVIAVAVKKAANGRCIRCGHVHEVATGYVLTVHHFDGNKSNSAWWNLLALCQRCHLRFQAIVDPEIPWLLEHSEWLKPYVAGFYASKYLGQDLTRTQVEARLDQLLGLERRT